MGGGGRGGVHARILTCVCMCACALVCVTVVGGWQIGEPLREGKERGWKVGGWRGRGDAGGTGLSGKGCICLFIEQ